MISSPTFSTSLGWLIRPQDMSVMCSRPSMPPRSTKAPYSVMFFTVPMRTLPSSSVPRVSRFFSAFSSSSTALRESTMLPRFLLTLMTRMRSSWPLRLSRLRTGRRSTCEPGKKARTPMSTASPPFTRSITRPVTTRRSW